MRVVQTTEQTAKQASEWVEELREWAATPGAARVDPGDCDELATLIERLAEWKPKPVPCDVGRYPCVHEERMPTYNCDRCPRSESDECAHCHFTRAKHEVAA